MTSFLVVDQEPKVCSAVSLLIENHPDWELIGVLQDPDQLTDVTRRCTPDILILDRNLPNLDLTEFLEELEQDCPTTKVIILSNDRDRDSFGRSPIHGLITKNSPPDRVINQIEMIAGKHIKEHDEYE
jgi:DNA-binding NarL/FixJ family response regulator